MADIALSVLGENATIPASLEVPTELTNRSKGYVFVHGLTTDKDEYLGLYKTLANQLNQDGHLSIRFDLAGHGSRTHESENLTLRRMVLETAGCLHYLSSHYKLNHEQLCLMGTSFGAPAAIATAALFPELVSHLVLLAPASDYTALYLDPTDAVRRQRYEGLREQCLINGQPFLVDNNVYFPPELAFEFATVDITALFSKLNCEISILHGNSDKIIPIAFSQQLASRNAKAQFIELADTEHGFTEVADEIGDAVKTKENIATILGTLL